MKNVEIKREGSVLTLTIDLSKQFGASSSGKTIIVASTEGNQRVLGALSDGSDVFIGLNVYRYPTRR